MSGEDAIERARAVDLLRLIAQAATVAPDRVALTGALGQVDYRRLAGELAGLQASMGAALGADALLPIALGALAPDLLMGGLAPVLAGLWADLDEVFPSEPDEPEPTLAARFAAQVVRTPDAVALRTDGAALTYREFDARVNRLARYLIGLGVGPDVRVGVAIRRSVDLLVAIYAVIQAGGAYVPIDPDQPAERNDYVLSVAEPLCVFFPPGEGKNTHSGHAVHLGELDLSGYRADPVTDAERLAVLRADHLAYVIFTSGSTGRPKGVGVSHAAIVANLDWRQAEYGFGPDDVVVQKTPFTFDVSVWELFWPLQVGASLFVAEPGGHRDPAYLTRIIRDHRITVAHFVPSMLAVFVAEARASDVASLRSVFASGEALPARTAARLREVSAAELHNLYGPTEAAVDVTHHEVTAADEVSVPIGVAVPGTRLVVLDDGLRPVPSGVVGELYLAGAQLARGYLGRPDLTADRFVAGAGGSRLYRTGDLVRRRRDGGLDYVGRTDFQVKLRGLRIELGEIEAALTDLPEVAQAVATVVTDTSLGQRLVAYVVPVAGADFVPDAAAERLGNRLPDYMIPAQYVLLDAFPVNPSGKLDRRALPVPAAPATTTVYREPTTDTEALVVKVFAELLGADRVGVDDEFFGLGGNSLLATRAVARINAETGVAIGVREFFDAPTAARFAELVDAARRSATVGPPRPVLVAQDRPERVPLSLAQQRMWLLNRLDPGSAVDNIPLAIRLTGALDVAALGAALRDVEVRHEILRTVYPEVDGIGLQRVGEPGGITIEHRRVPGDEVAAAVAGFAVRGFDVTVQVPVRAAVFEIGPAEHVVVLVAHHIASDGFSLAPLTRDLLTAYAARVGGHPPVWAPLPVQYADYAMWQRAVSGDPADPESLAARQIGYWRAELDGAPELLELPTDRPRPTVASHRGGVYRTEIGRDGYLAVRELARMRDATEFMVLHAALAVTLARLAATNDVVIGTPVAGRGEAVLDELVGMFVNTLPLRTIVDPATTVADFLDAVRAVDLAALSHAEVPFEQVVEQLDPVRSRAWQPIFQVMLAYQNLDTAPIELPGVVVEPLAADTLAAKFDLYLTFAPDGERCAIEVIYATDLFDEASVADLMSRWGRTLTAMAARPDAAVGDLELLTDTEQRSLVLDRNATEHELPDGDTLAALFADRVQRSPHARAVEFEGAALTYAEFGARVNRLARYLIGIGVGPEVVVGLCGRRSLDLLVGMYAIVVAGGAYLPLDPDQPVERNAYIVDAAGPLCVLFPPGEGESAHSGCAVHLGGLDLSGYAAGPVSDVERRGVLRSGHPGYVLFTSGSTGRPKGVVVSHAAIVNQVRWMQSAYGFTADDVYLQKTAFTFDVSLWGYFAALTAGTPVVLAAPDGHRDPVYLAGLIAEHRVTLVDFVPSMLAAFTAAVDPAALASLRAVFVIGEALTARAAAAAFARLSGAALHNVYGPTEAAVSITAAEYRGGSAGSVPIGVPEWNSQVYVLDTRLHPVPAGVCGELYLAGVQLARGYAARPDLSADRFVASPFGSGERMYRTGDLVRWLPSGELDYLGRNDSQVKFRGQRIELGEIESVLADVPEIERAVTLVVGSDSGDQLVGYVVPAPGATLDAGQVRAHAALRLPGYMVPGYIVQLPEIPVSSSGKLDRAALPAPTVETRAFRAPVTPAETAIAETFAELLGVARVGADDDFFALGGNSLIATRVVARIADRLGAELPLRLLFEAPTVAGLAARATSGATDRPSAGPTPRPRPDTVPLSLAQQRMWFLARFDPESSADNLVQVLRLAGQLDAPALAAAFADVIGRHEILRTCYPAGDGSGHQDILPAGAVPIDLAPLELGETDVPAALAGLALEGFDVTVAPPLRIRLLRLAPDRHLLVLVLHHIAADGFSFGPLARDLVTGYLARTAGAAPDWPALPVQYADYALWQRAMLGRVDDPASRLARQLAFWTDRLAGLPDRLDLPTDRPRPRVAGTAGAVFRFGLDADTCSGIRGLARSRRATPFMVVHAAIAVLLARLSATTDIAIGTPVAGRGHAALDDLIGMFVNTLVLRTAIDPATTVGDLLEQVRDADLAAFAHAELPFEMLVDALSPVRTQAHHPLFQVALFFQNLEQVRVRLPGLELAAYDPQLDLARFDLQFGFAESADGRSLDGEIRYATDLFDEPTIAAIAGRLGRVVAGMLAGPATAVGDLMLLTDDELDDLVVRRNDTAHELPAGDTLAGLFADRVRRTPAATALIADGARITFGELADRTWRIARYLIESGVRPGDLVGVAMGRSVDLVAAMQAVLAAGGAYVPLDPAHPESRNAHILATARPVCVLTTAGDGFAAGDVPVVAIDPLLLDERCAAPVTDADRAGPLRPEHPAYVLFTSGSTGRPKGVAVPHAAIVNQVRWFAAECALAPDDVYLQKTATTFDVSAWGYLGALLAGVPVVLAALEGHRDPAYLAGLIAEHRVTATDFVPSMLSVFAAGADRSALASLRRVFVIGEALPAAVARAFADVCAAVVHNVYGPTEAAVSITAGRYRGGSAGSVPIGVPEWNSRVYVLDSRLHPVPDGVPGELYLAGTQLALGYVRRPELTTDRFVADPFVPGVRMYRTGDLVRWLPSGELDFLGRNDSQVKFRGQRIELGEIESVLLDAPGVTHAVVQVVPTGAGDRLVAYLVGDRGAPPDPAIVGEHARRALPGYMVPGTVVELAELPLNTSGKVDRRALPAPVFETNEYLAPATRMEEIVAEVFAEVLGTDRVGAGDDFFALGGNSLAAMRLTARLSERSASRIGVRDVFELPTVRALAAHAEAGGPVDRPPLGPQPRPAVIPLSPAQQRMWFRNRFDPDSGVDNLPFVLRLTGRLDPAALAAAFGDLVARHESLRTRYPDIDGVGHQQVLPAARTFPEPVDSAPDRLAADLGSVIAPGFDVTAEPPLRFKVFRLGPEEHVAVLVLHHIAGDAFSVGPLVRDLAAAYLARIDGAPVERPPLSVQYADYALWQRQVLGRADDADSPAAGQLRHWRAALAGLPDRLDLPTDFPRAAVADGRGAEYRAELPAEVRAGLDAIARAQGATLFMAVHAVLALVLARRSGSTDIAIGTPVAGRGEAHLDELIGMFVNTLVLRTDVDERRSFAEQLEHTRGVDLDAFAHADIPFEALVEVLDPPRSRSRHPLFQVMLTMHGFAPVELELPGLRLDSIEIETTTAKFDLQFTVVEVPDGLQVRVDYATGLFAEATIADLVGELSATARAVLARPRTPLHLVTAADDPRRAEVLRARNATDHPVPAQTLAGAAAGAPEAVALVFGELTVSYAEFAARVNRLARHLIGLGVGPETTVAVAMPRSVDLLVAIHAVVTAGGAYVPLDPDQPAERNAHVIAAAAPLCVLLPPGGGKSTHGQRQLHVAELDLADVSAEPVTDADRVAPLRPDHPAYVMFTSGSTGRPKGVVVSHAAIVNRLRWMQGEYRLTAADVVLQKTPFTFDVSVWELFWPLQIGARLVIAQPGGHRDPDYLAAVIERHRVTTAHFVPSMLEVFLGEPGAAGCGSLARVFASGEALPAGTAARLRAVLPGAALHNLYGPTEAAVDVTHHAVTAADSASVPIGRPVWNTRVHVLDTWLRPVPDGVVGELYLAGVQLARGYAARSDLTADRFVADPTGPPGARMYRTGDLGCWNRAGELEYLGRNDFQVKLHGLRIELGEIEAQLREVPGVGQAAVLLRDEQLVGYVTGTVDGDAVRAGLARRLPGYLVPATVLVLDGLPTGATGKLDRAALPAPPARLGGYTAPAAGVESVVAGIVAEVLGVERVGRDDDFFALGGTSLTAMQVVSRVRRATGAPIGVVDLFDAPTVAGIAATIATAIATGPAAVEPFAIEPRPERIPLSLTQYRLWLSNRIDPAAATYNIPMVLRLSGPVDTAALVAAAHDLIARHEPLRTYFPADAAGPVQRIAGPDTDPVPVVVEDVADAAAAAVRATELVGAGFDVGERIPVRIGILRLPRNEHVLVLVAHHIVVDGGSIAVLARDMMVAYAARAAGQEPGFAPLAAQYADFAVWQRRVIGTGEDPDSPASGQIGYWRAELAGLAGQEPVVPDRWRTATPTNRGGALEFDVDREIAGRIARLARDTGATTFMVLHAALAVLLARLGGSTDVAIGSPVAVRDDPAFDGVVGMFVNTVVVRIQVRSTDSFTDVVRASRAKTLAALAHADAPFEEVAQAVVDLVDGPLFQVALSVDPVQANGFELGELSVTALGTGDPPAKFDLQLTVSGTADGGLSGSWIYARDLFDESTARQLAEWFAAVLDRLTGDPAAAVGGVDLRAAGEPATPVAAAAVQPDRSALLPSLFAETVEDDPDAVGFVHGDREWTFGELDGRSARLARYLIAQGVGPGDRVAVPAPPGIDAAAAVWAVVQTGAALDAGSVGAAGFVVDRHDGSGAVTIPLPTTEQRAGFGSTPITYRDRVRRLADSAPGWIRPDRILDQGELAAVVTAAVERLDMSYESRCLIGGCPTPGLAAFAIMVSSVAGATVFFVDDDAEADEALVVAEITHAFVRPADAARIVRLGLPDLSWVVADGYVAGTEPGAGEPAALVRLDDLTSSSEIVDWTGRVDS